MELEKQRINKYLSSKGIASRREVDRMIDAGRILVNGSAPDPGEKVSDEDEIRVDGCLVGGVEEKLYFLLNKPSGVISSAKDDRGRKTVVDIIGSESRIYPVGRLDYDSEGLIILTNDGDLFNKVIHPRAKVYKTYTVKVRGRVADSGLRSLRDGVELEDGVTLPAKVKKLSFDGDFTWMEISIREGRNRQIRRMCKNIGQPVVYLRRDKLGELGLGTLGIGQYRKLSKEEVAYLKGF